MFSRGGMVVGCFIGRIQSNFKDAMETDEGKKARERIMSSMKEARLVASSILKSTKSAFKDFTLVEQKGNQSTNPVHSDSPFGLNPRLGTESWTDVHPRMSHTSLPMTLHHHPEALARPYQTPKDISYNQGTEQKQHVKTPLQQVQRFDLGWQHPRSFSFPLNSISFSFSFLIIL
jgi:hypothetical protein